MWRRTRRVRSDVVPFVLGFGACAVLARLLLPQPVAATSPGTFALASPAQVVAEAGASVVSLDAYPAGRSASAAGLWPRLLGGMMQDDPEPEAVASGVIISERGYVVTNNHVVADAGRLRARLVDGREFAATVVGTDPYSDLALLKISGTRLQAARLGESRHVRPGDSVVAIGNPLGFENSVTVGVVSANRTGPFRVDGRALGDMIQTDAAINQGNSGGGLFSADGRLIGINTAILVPRGGSGSIGIGFAIPAHRVRPVVDSLIARGRVLRPWLGIQYHTPALSSLVRRVRSGVGLLVEEVVPGSPAAEAGLQRADILRQIGDCSIRSADDLYGFMDRYRPGEKVRARVLRGGAERTVTLILGEKKG